MRVLELCLEHDLVKERRLLAHIYELFLVNLANSELADVVANILISITSNMDLCERRVKLVRRISNMYGVSYGLNALRWLFRELRPDLEPNCPPSPTGRPIRKSILHMRFRKLVVAAGSDIGAKEGLGWEAGQLAGAIVFKEGRRELALPTAETINLLPGLVSQSNASRRPVATLTTTEELRDHMESVLLPNNIISLIGIRGSVNILARKEVVERFSINLYHTLKKELVFVHSRLGKQEAAVRRRRQEKLLGHANRFQERCFQAVPVIGRCVFHKKKKPGMLPLFPFSFLLYVL